MSDLRERTTSSRARTAAMVAILGLGGCGEAIEDAPVPDSPRSAAAATSTIEAACWAVGVLTPTCEPKDCPDAWTCPAELDKGWLLQGNHMFVDGSQALAAVGLVDDDVPLHLRRFCLYRAKGPGTTLQEPKIPASIDCPVAVAHADSLASVLGERLRELFQLHADAEPSALVPGPSPVEVAIVDTHSDRSASGATVAHAKSVQRVVESLGCPAGGCGVFTTHALALPLDHDGTPLDPDDGIYGTRAHLALGVVEAVAEFRRHATSAKDGRRLVVNLSVGWTAEMGVDCGLGEDAPWCGDHVGEMLGYLTTSSGGPLPWRYATESLHAALLFASCNGALLVAAAGNARDDSCNLDPVAPAVWGSYPAPTVQECEALGFSPPPEVEALLPASTDTAWPLVLPVSAERPDGSPIAATRPGSITPLVAPGWHVALDAADTPLTGTSISAAAVSGAAALVWSQAPTLDAGDVVQTLYAAGKSSASSSQLAVHGWPVGTAVRRLSVCAAQPLGGGACVGPGVLEAAIADLAAVADPEAAARVTVEHDAIAIGLAPDDCNACGAKAMAWLPPTPDATEDAWFFDSCSVTPTTFAFDARSELAGPQPTVPICPECPLVITHVDGRARAYLSLEPSYLDGSVTWTAANLVLVDAVGNRAVFDLPLSTVLDDLVHGETVAFELAGSWRDLTHASINAVLADGRTGDAFVRGNELMLLVR